MTAELPRFIRDLLASPPAAGTGVHSWLFKIARQLHAHRNEQEIVDLLRATVYGCGRAVPEREIVAAVRSARDCAWQPNGTGRPPLKPEPKWPQRNQAAIDRIVADGPALVDLWEASPWRFESNESSTEVIVDRLFPGNPLLCVGQSSSEFSTRTREEWRGLLSTKQLVVPSPMSAVSGKTKDGKDSEHSLDNTGPRRFLVVEFDEGTTDQHAALLWHLAQRAPLALAVHSGGKSLHGWFFCAGQPEEKLRRFMRCAVAIGGDPATWTKSQFVRTPDGTRENGKRQTVFYFNPAVIR